MLEENIRYKVKSRNSVLRPESCHRLHIRFRNIMMIHILPMFRPQRRPSVSCGAEVANGGRARLWRPSADDHELTRRSYRQRAAAQLARHGHGRSRRRPGHRPSVRHHHHQRRPGAQRQSANYVSGDVGDPRNHGGGMNDYAEDSRGFTDVIAQRSYRQNGRLQWTNDGSRSGASGVVAPLEARSAFSEKMPIGGVSIARACALFEMCGSRQSGPL